MDYRKMRKKIVAANWKMNGQTSSIRVLLTEICKSLPDNRSANCIIFPPAIYLPLTGDMLAGTNLQWGAQNVYPEESGAYTGEISGPMLQDMHCKYVLVGHSERRTLFAENEKI